MTFSESFSNLQKTKIMSTLPRKLSEENRMTSLSKVIDKLKAHGYTANLGIQNDELVDFDQKRRYQANELQLDHEYRTEGATNPDDESLLFAVSAKNGMKGILVAPYGANADTSIIEFMNRVDQQDGITPTML